MVVALWIAVAFLLLAVLYLAAVLGALIEAVAKLSKGQLVVAHVVGEKLRSLARRQPPA